MSIENNSNVDSNTTDDTNLDDFSAEFFEGSNPERDAPPKEEKETPSADDDSNEEEVEETEAEGTEDEADEDDDTLANDEDDSDDQDDGEEESEPKPKKKNRFQERIDELTKNAREAERKAEDLERRLEDAVRKLEQNNKPEPKNQPAQTSDTTGPSPDDKNEDGEDKYPLGEFDPNYIRDLTKHTIQQEREAARQRDEQERQKTEAEKQRTALQADWDTKLDSARERYPDLDEKGQELAPMFEDIDPAYGEYLGATLMSLDYGPDVLYYLANHPDEAVAIAKSGPQKATIALGRLEARFADAQDGKNKARPKVSNAPNPPPRNKGSSVAKGKVAPDTDDLEAFSKTFFKEA